MPAPTPMPACAPVDNPPEGLEDCDGVGVDVDEEAASGVPALVVVVVVPPPVVPEIVVADMSPTVVAARWETSKDHWSLFAPAPTEADEFGFKSNQHGVSEPGQSSLTVAVLFLLPTPCFCFSDRKHIGELRWPASRSSTGISTCHSRPTSPSADSQNVKSQGSVKSDVYCTCT